MDMKIFDIMLKDEVVRAATSLPKATLNAMAVNHQNRIDYVFRVLNASSDIQIAVRAKAQLLNDHMFSNQLVDILDIWFSSQFTGIAHWTTLSGFVTLPQETIVVDSTSDFPSIGELQIGSQIVSYTGKMQGQDFGSFTGCTGGSGGPYTGVVNEAGVPSAAEAEERRDLFIAAFTRRSKNAIGALNYINGLHVWSWEH